MTRQIDLKLGLVKSIRRSFSVAIFYYAEALNCPFDFKLRILIYVCGRERCTGMQVGPVGAGKRSSLAGGPNVSHGWDLRARKGKI